MELCTLPILHMELQQAKDLVCIWRMIAHGKAKKQKMQSMQETMRRHNVQGLPTKTQQQRPLQIQHFIMFKAGYNSILKCILVKLMKKFEIIGGVLCLMVGFLIGSILAELDFVCFVIVLLFFLFLIVLLEHT